MSVRLSMGVLNTPSLLSSVCEWHGVGGKKKVKKKNQEAYDSASVKFLSHLCC